MLVMMGRKATAETGKRWWRGDLRGGRLFSFLEIYGMESIWGRLEGEGQCRWWWGCRWWWRSAGGGNREEVGIHKDLGSFKRALGWFEAKKKGKMLPKNITEERPEPYMWFAGRALGSPLIYCIGGTELNPNMANSPRYLWILSFQ